MSQLPAPSFILELENRQDEALRSLAELESRLEQTLAEFGAAPPMAKGVRGGVRPVEHRAATGACELAPEPGILKLHEPLAAR